MANVHGFGSGNNPPNNNNNPPPNNSSQGLGGPGIMNSFGQGGSLFGNVAQDVDPRKENFFQMIQFNMCPS